MRDLQPWQLPLHYGVRFCPFCGQETSEQRTAIWEDAYQGAEMTQLESQGLPVLRGRVVFAADGTPLWIERRWTVSSRFDTCRGGQFTTFHVLTDEERKLLAPEEVRQRLMGLQLQFHSKAAKRLERLWRSPHQPAPVLGSKGGGP